MLYNAQDYFDLITDVYNLEKSKGIDIRDILHLITNSIPIASLQVSEKVKISTYLLNILDYEERKELAKQLIEEQVLEQRIKLTHWSTITAQSSQIDTGYIAQHLVSLQTTIAGQGMRGKGDDLCDGSEIKSANFLDSLDKKGATAPRWNFTAINQSIMEQFLKYSSLYLLSMDLNPKGKFRTRIWKVNVEEHMPLRNRYIEWLDKLGYTKFRNMTDKPSVNFQLFPPHSMTEENFARHGNGRSNGFDKLDIYLEGCVGSELIFRADEVDGKIVISKF